MAKNSEKNADVRITAAKGRPMLTWVGKRPLSRVTAFPAQHVETFDPVGRAPTPAASPTDAWRDWPAAYPKGGLLFHGDNKEVLAHLLANGFRGKVNLIYIDPPFDSGADYVRKVSLRGAKGTAKLNGETYTLGEQIQYTDIWANDNYLQFMYERLMLMKELLAEGGSLFTHCDERQGHRLRMILDEVMSPECFQNEVIWYYSNKYGANSQTFDVFHNSIYWYSKGKRLNFNPIRVPVKEPRKQPVRKWNKQLNKNEWLRDENGDYITPVQNGN
ncbi:MAG: site-specific DNA-methyltransferase [Acidobacteriota bacterium]